jgi:hypothetical protein
VQPLLQGVKYHLVGVLNLTIAPRVSDGDVPNIDPAVLTVTPEPVVVAIGTQVCDDAIGEPVAMHNFIQGVEYHVDLGAGNRLDLDPLGELVDGH